MKKILVLCTGNSCRSQILEAWLRHYSEGKFEVYSAGSYKNRKMVVDFVSEDGEHEFSISGVAQRFTQVFRKRVRANTTYSVNVRNKKDKVVEQGLIRSNTFGQRGKERKLDRGFTFEDSHLVQEVEQFLLMYYHL